MNGPTVSPTVTPSLPHVLGKVFAQKFLIRWMVVERGIIAALFWTAVAIGGGWLRHLGYSTVVTAVLAAWLVLSLPALYFQMATIIDMIGYVFTGKISFYPLMQGAFEAKTDVERHDYEREMFPAFVTSEHPTPAPKPGPFLSALVSTISMTSPLCCFATWALVVLFRIPQSKHERIVTPRRVVTLQHEGELRVYSETFAHLSR